MPKLPGSGIRMASIPLAQTVVPFSPESGGSDPGPGPTPGRSSGGAGLAGILAVLLGLGGLLLAGTSEEEATVPPPPSVDTAAGPTVGPLEVPAAMRIYLLP